MGVKGAEKAGLRALLLCRDWLVDSHKSCVRFLCSFIVLLLIAVYGRNTYSSSGMPAQTLRFVSLFAVNRLSQKGLLNPLSL
jgi:hypothetical protein